MGNHPSFISFYLGIIDTSQTSVIVVVLSLVAIAMLMYFLQRFGWLLNLFAQFNKTTSGFDLELEDEDPENPRSLEEKQAIRLYYQAYHLDRRHRHLASIKLLRKAIELSDQWRFHLALAGTLNFLEQQTDALIETERAKELCPDQLGFTHWDILNLSASIKADLGRFTEAQDDFAEALRLSSQHFPEHTWVVYKNWGACHLQMDDPTGALEKFDKANQLINYHCLPASQDLVSYQARALYELNRFQEALDVLEKGIKEARDQHQPVDTMVHMSQGLVLVNWNGCQKRYRLTHVRDSQDVGGW